MSIYANNYIIDEITGEKKLVKHLNKSRVDRGYKSSHGWNKSGKKARDENRMGDNNNRRKDRHYAINKSLNEDLREPRKFWVFDKTDWKAYWEEKRNKEKQEAIKALEDFKQTHKNKLENMKNEIGGENTPVA